MLHSIKSKILVLVIGLMAATSLTFAFFATRYYQSEITAQHHKLANETLRSTMRVMDTEYNDLLSWELNAIQNQRTLMKNIGTGILALVNAFYRQQKNGYITEQEAKEHCLNRLDSYRYQNDHYFFVCDVNLVGLSHPNKEMVGKSWTGFEDLQKRDALERIREILKIKTQAYTVFMWPRLEDMEPVRQMGLFLYFPQWEWIIGTAHEIIDIEQISQTQEKKTLFKLNTFLGQLGLNDIGGVLIFNSQGTILTCSSNLSECDLNAPGTRLEKSIQNQLKNAAAAPEHPFEYLFAVHARQKKMPHIVYADYYKPMDWYVSAFVAMEKSLETGSAIAKRQFLLFGVVLLFGIVVAAGISTKITRPLSLLTRYARDLPDTGFTLEPNPLLESMGSSTGDAEIKQLADSFAYMETMLGKNFQALKTKTDELKRLNEHILCVEEMGRRSVASELHDSVAQTLAMSISKIKSLQTKGHPVDLQAIAEIQGYLEQTVKEVRSMIYELTPIVLDDFDIDIALGYLIEESNEKYNADILYINNIDTRVHLKKLNKIVLYRAVHELFINIIKHSGSKEAQIELSADDHHIFLRVEDKGLGFDLNPSINTHFYGFGTYSLSERIENLGGTFKLFSAPGRGTKVLISIPIERK